MLSFRETKSCFSLMSYGENQYDIVIRFIAVERDIAGSTLRNDEFAQTRLGFPSNHRMAGEYCNCLINQVQRLKLRARPMLCQEVADPFEIR